ncbi:MAG TPA: hypothetical protein DEP38_15230 [Cyanobacteria bacterium UBA9226]|nr:hypothetical protein [Cyanobacteria bacterium UBA9226]
MIEITSDGNLYFSFGRLCLVSDSVKGTFRLSLESVHLLASPLIVTGASQTITVGMTYIANNASAEVLFSLPITPSIGDTFSVIGCGAGGWRVAQIAAQQQFLNGAKSQVGILGQIRSFDHWSRASWTCIATTPNAVWLCYDISGNLKIDE